MRRYGDKSVACEFYRTGGGKIRNPWTMVGALPTPKLVDLMGPRSSEYTASSKIGRTAPQTLGAQSRGCSANSKRIGTDKDACFADAKIF